MSNCDSCPVMEAYAAYDSDPRVSGVDDANAFIEAVRTAVERSGESSHVCSCRLRDVAVGEDQIGVIQMPLY